MAEEDLFALEKIGVWSEPSEFQVTRERMIAYAEATNDQHKSHLSGELAPPIFAVVPTFTQMAAVTMEVVPPNLMMRVVHGEQDIRIRRPILAGDVLTSRGKVVGIHGKSSGVVVTALIKTRDAAEALVNEQYFAGFFRGGNWPHEAGEPFPVHDLDPTARERDPDAVTTAPFDTDQTWRYAEASGDPMPIHTDEDFAKAMGFPGIIVHGLCTMAFASQAVIAHACPDDPALLRRLAVRFSAVGRPGQIATTNVWDIGPGTLAFQTATGEGAVLIKDGLAEIGDMR
ncbi:MAG: MaoC/PaaZ C-terminal domain-containing protein [Jatrophihabitantaceae bacterium]